MGACVELGSNIFTVSSVNKARDGDTLHTTKEATVLYIGSHYGEDTSKEFGTGVLTELTITPQDAAISVCVCGFSLPVIDSSFAVCLDLSRSWLFLPNEF